eukprot:419523-Amphidinium_carterae.1
MEGLVSKYLTPPLAYQVCRCERLLVHHVRIRQLRAVRAFWEQSVEGCRPKRPPHRVNNDHPFFGLNPVTLARLTNSNAKKRF